MGRHDNNGHNGPITEQPKWVDLALNNPIQAQTWEDIAMNNPISTISDTLDDLSPPEPINRDIWRKLDRGWIPRVDLAFAIIANILSWAYFIVGMWLFFSSSNVPSGQECTFHFGLLLYQLYTFFIGGYVSMEDSWLCTALKESKKAEPVCDGPGCCPKLFDPIRKQLKKVLDFLKYWLCCEWCECKGCSCQCSNMCESCRSCLKKTREALKCIKYWLCCEWCQCKCCSCQCPKCECPECEWLNTLCRFIWSGIWIAWYIGATGYKLTVREKMKNMRAECLERIVGPSDVLLGLSTCIFFCKSVLLLLNVIVFVRKRYEMKLNQEKVHNQEGICDVSVGVDNPSEVKDEDVSVGVTVQEARDEDVSVGVSVQEARDEYVYAGRNEHRKEPPV